MTQPSPIPSSCKRNIRRWTDPGRCLTRARVKRPLLGWRTVVCQPQNFFIPLGLLAWLHWLSRPITVSPPLCWQSSNIFAKPESIERCENESRSNKLLRIHAAFILGFHMTSRPPFWCPHTLKCRPCWCPDPILRELKAIIMQTSCFRWKTWLLITWVKPKN